MNDDDKISMGSHMLFRTLPLPSLSFALAFCAIGLVSPVQAAPVLAAVGAESAGETKEREREARAEKQEKKEEREELEHERALERIEASNAEDDKFGPLGCVCLSVLLPPLTPVWIILMILVDGKPVPTNTTNDGLSPMLRDDGQRIDDLDKKRRMTSEVAQAY